jgi:hypothetical protein
MEEKRQNLPWLLEQATSEQSLFLEYFLDLCHLLHSKPWKITLEKGAAALIF